MSVDGNITNGDGGPLNGHGVAVAMVAIFAGMGLVVAFAASDGAIFGMNVSSSPDNNPPVVDSDASGANVISRDAFDHVIPIDRYIAKVANMAGIDWRVQRVAVDIAQQTKGNILLSGKDPVGIAAAYLYISACICGYNMYLTDIANFSRVTEITIRTRCKEILSSFNLEIRVKKVDRATLTSSCSA